VTTFSSRIGYVLKRFPRLSETFILNEILGLEAHGVHVHIISLYAAEQGVRHAAMARLRARVTYLRAEPAEAAAAAVEGPPSVVGPEALERDAARVAEAVIAERLEHLHAHFATAATDLARAASRLTGLPYSFTAHAKDIYHQGIEPRQLRAKIAEAAFVVTVSDFNRNYLLETCGSDLAPKLRRIYNGIDLRQFAFYGPDGRDGSAVLGVGRLIEKKGFADLIEAIGLLRSRPREVRLTIVGRGALQTELAAQIDRLALGNCVQLVGAVAQDRVAALMRSHALLALPCVVARDGNRDALPTVLLEAMATGLPVVSTSLTGIPEVIDHGRTGWIVPPQNPPALADAIAALMDDGSFCRRATVAARQKAERQFDLRKNTERLARLFGAAVPAVSSVSRWPSERTVGK